MVVARQGIPVVPFPAVEQEKAVALPRDIVHPPETNAAASTEPVLLAGIVVGHMVATLTEESVAVMADIALPVTNAISWMGFMHAVRMQDVQHM
jgi:hypothetical protein